MIVEFLNTPKLQDWQWQVVLQPNRNIRIATGGFLF